MEPFFIFFLSLITFSIPRTHSDPRFDLATRNCSSLIISNTSAYVANYWKAVEDVQNSIMLGNSFGTGSAGRYPYKMYVMAQCHGDLSLNDCRTCFQSSKNVLASCIPRVGGRVHLDGCFIRAANYSFFEESVTPSDTLICGSTKNESRADATKELIHELIKGAPLYGWDEQKMGDESVFGLVNCWIPLDNDSCSSCLESAASSVLSCLPSTDGRALNAGCIIRYSDYDFLNENGKSSLLVVTSYILLYAISSMFSIITGGCVGTIIYKQRRKRQIKKLNEEMENSLFSKILRFKYSTIEKATNHFNELSKLGQGGFGEVFKGCLPDGREIAVKRLFISTACRSQDVLNEVNVISLAEHKNLVRFLGCSLTSHDSLLVFEFLPNSSLDRFLFDSEKKHEIDWKKRLGIIIGTARGLTYLHNECDIRIVHRDIKASNILLDSKFRPKISDFGLAMFHAGENTPSNPAVAGTLGYMAPEYLARGQLTEKVDVYSYGVLVLEILSGVQNNKFGSDDSLTTLVTSTWKHFLSNTISEIIDESLEIVDREEVLRVAQVGLLCTQEDASLRPTMAETIRMLTLKESPLSLPSKPPFVDECMELSPYCNASHEQANSSNTHLDRHHDKK